VVCSGSNCPPIPALAPAASAGAKDARAKQSGQAVALEHVFDLVEQQHRLLVPQKALRGTEGLHAIPSNPRVRSTAAP